MNNRSRLLLPLGAALLLGAALVLRVLLTSPEAPAPAVTPPSLTQSPAATSAPVSTPVAARPRVVPGPSGPQVVSPEGRGATVVPIGPGDEVPEPEVENAPPQQNDPIEPEKPQTAEWKHGKLVRITELMERDVERLEEERVAAEASGNTEEAKRLAVQLSRHRANLQKLHGQKAALAGQAGQEQAAQ